MDLLKVKCRVQHSEKWGNVNHHLVEAFYIFHSTPTLDGLKENLVKFLKNFLEKKDDDFLHLEIKDIEFGKDTSEQITKVIERQPSF